MPLSDPRDALALGLRDLISAKTKDATYCRLVSAGNPYLTVCTRRGPRRVMPYACVLIGKDRISVWVEAAAGSLVNHPLNGYLQLADPDSFNWEKLREVLDRIRAMTIKRRIIKVEEMVDIHRWPEGGRRYE